MSVKDNLNAKRTVRRRVTKGLQQIFACVCISAVNRLLASRQNNRAGRILNHVAERRGSICHCIRSMRNDKAVIHSPVFADHIDDPRPLRGSHVRGINVV